MQKLGFGTVRRSTLADAKLKRPTEFLEVFFTSTAHAEGVAPAALDVVYKDKIGKRMVKMVSG